MKRLTTVQLETLRDVASDPTGRLEDRAERLGKSIHAVHQTLVVLHRLGYLDRITRGKRSTSFVLSAKCGWCPHCERAHLVEGLHEVVPFASPKTSPRDRELMVRSPARAEAVADRFQVDPSYVRRLRAKRKVAAHA